VTFEQRPEWGELVREGILGRGSSSESAVLVTPLKTPGEAHGWIAMEGLRERMGKAETGWGIGTK